MDSFETEVTSFWTPRIDRRLEIRNESCRVRHIWYCVFSNLRIRRQDSIYKKEIKRSFNDRLHIVWKPRCHWWIGSGPIIENTLQEWEERLLVVPTTYQVRDRIHESRSWSLNRQKKKKVWWFQPHMKSVTEFMNRVDKAHKLGKWKIRATEEEYNIHTSGQATATIFVDGRPVDNGSPINRRFWMNTQLSWSSFFISISRQPAQT